MDLNPKCLSCVDGNYCHALTLGFTVDITGFTPDKCIQSNFSHFHEDEPEICDYCGSIKDPYSICAQCEDAQLSEAWKEAHIA